MSEHEKVWRRRPSGVMERISLSEDEKQAAANQAAPPIPHTHADDENCYPDCGQPWERETYEEEEIRDAANLSDEAYWAKYGHGND